MLHVDLDCPGTPLFKPVCLQAGARIVVGANSGTHAKAAAGCQKLRPQPLVLAVVRSAQQQLQATGPAHTP